MIAPVWFRETDDALTLGTGAGQVTLTKLINFETGADLLLTGGPYTLDNRGDGQYLFGAAGVSSTIATVEFTLELVDDPAIKFEGFYTLDNTVAIKAVTDQFRFTIANQVDANALTGGGGGGATPQQIWEYAERSLTVAPLTAQMVWQYVSRELTASPPVSLDPDDIQTIADAVSASVGEGVADGVWAKILDPALYTPEQAGYLGTIMTKFSYMIAQLLAHTYNAGQIDSPYAALPGGTVPMYYKTNYEGISTVGTAWTTILLTPGVKVFYTTKARAEDKVPTIDAECEILDPVVGTIKIALTKEQLTVKPGEYFSQLQARLYVDVGDPPVSTVDQIWMMQEGKQLIKPTFKG